MPNMCSRIGERGGEMAPGRAKQNKNVVNKDATPDVLLPPDSPSPDAWGMKSTTIVSCLVLVCCLLLGYMLSSASE